MTADPLARLAAANPEPQPRPVSAPDALFASIVAEARRTTTAPRRRPRLVLALAVALAVALTGVAAGTATRLLSPADLFRNDPNQQDPALPAALRRQAIPGTERRVESVTVPGLGAVEIWAATGTKGAVCLAVRLPDGHWAGEHGGGTIADKVGGDMSGCWPRRADQSDMLLVTGFDRRELVYFPNRGDHPGWRLVYGVLEAQVPPTAVRIVDRHSGVEGRVVDGRYWALLVRDPGGQPGDTAAPPPPKTVGLVAYDAAGRVVADEGAAIAAASAKGR